MTSGANYARLNSTPVSSPAYTDATANGGATYYYAVTAVNTSGAESDFSNQVSKTIQGVSTLVAFSSASASPYIFSPNGDDHQDVVSIRFTLGAPDQVTVTVSDITGRPIATLVNNSLLDAGTYSVEWNGITALGKLAFDGMYTFTVSGAKASPVQGSFGINNTIPEVSESWYLAEGSTVGFEAYVLVQNPNDAATNVTFTFFKQDGTVTFYRETVPARTRTTVPIHREVPNTFSVSTTVEADLPIIVERAMYFNRGTAGHNSIGTTRTSSHWYLPANRTFPGDEDFILIVNPSSWPAALRALFYLDDQQPIVQTYSIGPNSRFTIPVHGIVPLRRVSVELESDRPVAAERAFYFQSRRGGSSGIGAVSPSQTWYFAEGDTASTTSLELFNPTDGQAVVTVNYMLEDGTVIPRSYVLPARRRLSVDTSEIGPNRRFSTELISDQPIVAERLVFSGSDVGDSIGSPTPAHIWNLAEGFTAFGYQTWVTIANPGAQAANVTVRLMKQNSENVLRTYSLGAKQRITVYLNDLAPGMSVSTQVTADQPIVVERTMKFAGGTGMHQAMGVRQ